MSQREVELAAASVISGVAGVSLRRGEGIIADGGHVFQLRAAGALDGPVVVLLGQDGAEGAGGEPHRRRGRDPRAGPGTPLSNAL